VHKSYQFNFVSVFIQLIQSGEERPFSNDVNQEHDADDVQSTPDLAHLEEAIHRSGGTITTQHARSDSRAATEARQFGQGFMHHYKFTNIILSLCPQI
jgi:hypothetical protein